MHILSRFGFKQTLRSAIIIGLVAGCMFALQGTAYQKTYTTKAERDKFSASLASVPSLGLLYGNPQELQLGAKGYMTYRVVGFMGVAAAVWGLAATTRLLRGSEEDGRWEVVRSGAVTARRATFHTLVGFMGAWALAYIIGTLLTFGAASASNIGLSFSNVALLNLLIFLPGLLFAMVGVYASQLALTRGRALTYGLVPLVLFFLLRGVANTHPANLHWLLSYTPFGWALLVNPLLASQAWWLLPFIVSSLAFLMLGIWYAERDLGSSIVSESPTTKPRYFWLKNSWQLALRQNKWSFAGWASSALALIGLIASLTKVAIDSTSDSVNLSKSVHALAGNNADLQIAFLGAGMVFLVMVLLLMAIAMIGSIRKDEAKQYLDSMLVAPQSRTHWIVGRLLLGYVVLLVTSFLSSLLLYAVARSQHIDLNMAKVMATGVCTLGSVTLLLGLGTTLFALWPRVAGTLLYGAVGWSFLVTLIASAGTLNTVVLHSSLFTYTSFNLADWPQWETFGYLTAAGLVLAAFGVIMFNQRDIITE